MILKIYSNDNRSLDLGQKTQGGIGSRIHQIVVETEGLSVSSGIAQRTERTLKNGGV